MDKAEKAKWIERVHQIPYAKLLGLELVDLKKGWAEMRLSMDRRHKNYFDSMHGGAISSLIDSVVFMALRPYIPPELVLTTVEMKLNYLRPVNHGALRATARIVHWGRRTMLGEADVFNQQGKLVAKGMVTYMVVEKDK